jgi:hypothetical protein
MKDYIASGEELTLGGFNHKSSLDTSEGLYAEWLWADLPIRHKHNADESIRFVLMP